MGADLPPAPSTAICSQNVNMLSGLMRLIARSTIVAFWTKHPETKAPLECWIVAIRNGEWRTTAEVQAAFLKAKVLNDERIRFEVSGDSYRLIAAFDFNRALVFVKFLGTHAEYDRVDAMNVTLAAARKISTAWNIPIQLLVAPYEKDGARAA